MLVAGVTAVTAAPSALYHHCGRAGAASSIAPLTRKWGGYDELSEGLLFDSPAALIETLSVVEAPGGTRLIITRRRSRTAPHD